MHVFVRSLKLIDKNVIKIIGAKEHNLKSVNVDIPKDKLIVITGPSGSGKSSLAMDTLYQEGRRRYIQSLSSYARQFLGVGKRPKVEKVVGVCPAIAIDQKTVGFNPRSTVGTITEIYDYLRLVFARAGNVVCPKCDIEISQGCPESISESIVRNFSGQTVWIAAQMANDKKGEFVDKLTALFKKGFNQFLIDGEFTRFDRESDVFLLGLKKTFKHTIFVLLDNFAIQNTEFNRIKEGVDRAIQATGTSCSIILESNKIENYSVSGVCSKCGYSSGEIEPRLFSFNSPVGACNKCQGLGVLYSDFSLSTFTTEEEPKHFLQTCQNCAGARLCKQALAVKIDGKNIFEVCSMPIKKTLEFFTKLYLIGQKAQIVARAKEEIVTRLQFLTKVGLGYLTLSRNAPTLSGGEGQRIRLATQIGSALSGVLYVLDEPSIGLHQRDNERLIEMLQKLRDVGNTVVVVEHDMDMIIESDLVIDMGPGAGALGGHITAIGTAKEIAKNPNSITGAYLSGRREIAVPERRRSFNKFLTLSGLSKNNLQNVAVKIPLEVMVVFTGVSGSGKSSLVSQTLAPALKNHFGLGLAKSSGLAKLEGVNQISSVVIVDQSPIGRTPRSNPATYIGIFGKIRTLFASLPESVANGFGIAHFSFNVDAGRCKKCSGEGSIKISMLFMEDEVVTCRQCKGQRYNQAVLSVKYKGKNINDVLCMTAREAVDFFTDFPPIRKRVEIMCQVGLEYMVLGQASTTLSGGEAQRIKLICELAKQGTDTLYILDEPTVGLHSCDVEKLLIVLNKLIELGNSVLIIEHNLELIKCADYIIDMGPEGGDEGGNVIATGTPEEICQLNLGYTAKYLKKHLKTHNLP